MLCQKKTNILRGGKDAHICRTDSAQPLSTGYITKVAREPRAGKFNCTTLVQLRGRINIWLTGPPAVSTWVDPESALRHSCGIQKSCELSSKRSWSVIDVTAAVGLHDFAWKSCCSPTVSFSQWIEQIILLWIYKFVFL